MSTSTGKFLRRRAPATKVSVLAPKVIGIVVGSSRLALGFLFTCHGVASLFGLFGRHAVASGTWPGFYAAVIQLMCGALVMTGALTRAAAVLGSGSMAYAYFTVHQAAGPLPLVNGGEAAALFCWSLLLLAASGPGAFALGPRISAIVGAARTAAGAGTGAALAETAPTELQRVAA